VWLTKDPAVESLSQLKGKTIAVPSLTGIIIDSIVYLLSRDGITRNDVKFVQTPFPTMGDQLAAGIAEVRRVIHHQESLHGDPARDQLEEVRRSGLRRCVVVARDHPADRDAAMRLHVADRRFEEAYAWRTQWPSLTQSIANVAMTAEDFERSLSFYNQTLELEPHAVDAMLGKARALTYLGRNHEAIAATDALIADRWFVGDARYWRALNESELDLNEEAWVDVEAAAKLLVNAQVPKLAGLIAYRRQQLELARAKFDESHTRNPTDCETTFYLGVVLAEQRAWGRTADVLNEAATCLEGNDKAYNEEIALIQASGDPPALKAAKIGRREQYIAKARRQIATSWFDIAVAYYNLARRSEARQFAEKVAADEQFGERARDLMARLARNP